MKLSSLVDRRQVHVGIHADVFMLVEAPPSHHADTSSAIKPNICYRFILLQGGIGDNDDRSRSMTITLPLQPGEESKLIALAQAKGLSTGAFVREALDKILADAPDQPEEPKLESRPIWEVILDNMKDVPPEEFAKLPKNGASEHDHYLYGHPKRHT